MAGWGSSILAPHEIQRRTMIPALRASGLTHRECARALGMSSSRVQQIEAKGRLQAKPFLGYTAQELRPLLPLVDALTEIAHG